MLAKRSDAAASKQPIQVTIRSLTTFLPSLASGDVLFIDIDNTLILNGFHKYHSPVQSTEVGLAAAIECARKAGVIVIGLTARCDNYRQHTLQELTSLNITLDGVIHAPMKQIADRKQLQKGLALKKCLTEWSQGKPLKRVYIVDDLKEQLEDVRRHCSEYPLITCHYLRSQCMDVMPGNQADSPFPTTLEKVQYVRSLGGGTQSVFLLEEGNARYVLKLGAHKDALKLEILCNVIFRELGVPVPDLVVYNTLPKALAKRLKLSSPYGCFQVTRYIEGKSDSESPTNMIGKHFVSIALLGNIDAAKCENYIVDAHGVAYLIDAGANFIFRARGDDRHEHCDRLTELDSMRDVTVTNQGHAWFGGLTQAMLTQQAHDIILKQESLNDLIWRVSLQLGIEQVLREQFISAFARRIDGLADRFQIKEKHLALADKPAVEGETAAGVLTYTYINGKPHVLLSKRVRHEWWDNFGGKSDNGDGTLLQTAVREVDEESNGQLKYTDYCLQQSPFHDLVRQQADGRPFIYRMYLVKNNVVDVSELKDHEHTAHRWVPLDALLKALALPPTDIENQATCLVMLANETIPIFAPLYQMLMQAPVQANLERLVVHKRIKMTRTRGIVGDQAKPVLSKQPVVSTPSMRRQQMAKTLVNRSEVLREFKQSRKISVPDVAQPVVLSPSELHMKMLLNDGYQENNVASNVMNILRYHFNHYRVSTHIVKQLTKLIQNEKNSASNYLHVYHACNDVVAFAYEVYTRLYEVLHANPEWRVFRAKGGAFNRFAAIGDFIATFSSNGKINNNNEDYYEYALSTNVFLFGNHYSEASCSVTYLLSNFASRDVDLKGMLNDLLAPFAVKESNVELLVDLHKTYAAKQQGALYQIKIAKRDAGDYIYPAASFGALNYYHDKRNIVDIIEHLLKNEKALSGEDLRYIKSLQARVMMVPTLPNAVNVVRQQSLTNEEQQVYDENLRSLINAIAAKILTNLSPDNRKIMHENFALFRMQKTLAEVYQVQHNVSISPDALAKAIVGNDAREVQRLLRTYPKWKSLKLLLPRKVSYINSIATQDKPVEDALSPLEMMAFHSDLSADVIQALYGENWYEELDDYFNDSVFLPRTYTFLLKLTEAQRYAFLNKDCNAQSLYEGLDHIEMKSWPEAIAAIISYLPPLKRSAFFANFHWVEKIDQEIAIREEIVYRVFFTMPLQSISLFLSLYDRYIIRTTTIINIVKNIPEKARLAYVNKYIDTRSFKNESEATSLIDVLPPAQQQHWIETIPNLYLKNRWVFSACLAALPDEAKWKFYRERKGLISLLVGTDVEFCSVIKSLPPSKRMDVMIEHENCLKVADWFIGALPYLSQAEAMKIAQRYESAINDCQQLAKVLTCVADDVVLLFMMNHFKHLVKSMDDLKSILSKNTIASKAKLMLLDTFQGLIVTLEDMALCCTHLSEQESSDFIGKQAKKFNLFDNFASVKLLQYPQRFDFVMLHASNQYTISELKLIDSLFDRRFNSIKDFMLKCASQCQTLGDLIQFIIKVNLVVKEVVIDIVDKHAHWIVNFNDLFAVLTVLPYLADKEQFLLKHGDKIRCYEDLCRVINVEPSAYSILQDHWGFTVANMSVLSACVPRLKTLPALLKFILLNLPIIKTMGDVSTVIDNISLGHEFDRELFVVEFLESALAANLIADVNQCLELIKKCQDSEAKKWIVTAFIRHGGTLADLRVLENGIDMAQIRLIRACYFITITRYHRDDELLAADGAFFNDPKNTEYCSRLLLACGPERIAEVMKVLRLSQDTYDRLETQNAALVKYHHQAAMTFFAKATAVTPALAMKPAGIGLSKQD